MINVVFLLRMTSASGDRRKMIQWSNESMEAAMEAVSGGEMSVSAAAKRFDVPRKTLDDRVKGRVRHGTKPGVSTVLSPEEETAL